MEEYFLFGVLGWLYDKVDARFGPVWAGIAQLALGLVFVAALAALFLFVVGRI